MNISLFIFVIVFMTITNAVAFFRISLGVEYNTSWGNFKMTHGKRYPSTHEESFRKKLFDERTKMIKAHNEQKETKRSYKLKMNQFMDMTRKELAVTNGFNMTQHLEWTQKRNKTNLYEEFNPNIANHEIPVSKNWKELGAVTEVKNQGHCGSCWAFSATGALEGQEFLKNNVLVQLSEQNLIDCSKAYDNNGCNGGSMDQAFRYVQLNGGIDSERSYPYEGVDTNTCRYQDKNKVLTDQGFIDIPSGDEEKLKIAVAMVGPVSVAIDASLESFRFYSEGIYDDPKCSSSDLDHGVLLVGYGTDDNGNDYWLVKNSWGETWGDRGYIKIARNKGNTCGIATSASFPKVNPEKYVSVASDRVEYHFNKKHKIESIVKETIVVQFSDADKR